MDIIAVYQSAAGVNNTFRLFKNIDLIRILQQSENSLVEKAELP